VKIWIRNKLKKLVDKSVGRALRTLQSFLLVRIPSTNLKTEIEKIAIIESAIYANENFNTAIYFEQRKQLHEFLLHKIVKKDNSVILEFGVYKGESINFFASKLPEIEFTGFDSFEGLEEDWPGFNYQKGMFSTMGKIPKVEQNVNLVKGWFIDTLPNFVRSSLPGKHLAMLHLDADTVTPTRFVLGELQDYIVTGTVVLFDEFLAIRSGKIMSMPRG